MKLVIMDERVVAVAVDEDRAAVLAAEVGRPMVEWSHAYEVTDAAPEMVYRLMTDTDEPSSDEAAAFDKAIALIRAEMKGCRSDLRNGLCAAAELLEDVVAKTRQRELAALRRGR